MPTPGAAPRGRMAREPQEACRGPTARAAPDARQDTPALPAAYGDALDAGWRRSGSTLPDAARAAIDGHARLLLAWTAAINLTAIREPAAVAVAHVIDSLTAARGPARARRRPVHRPRVAAAATRACRWPPRCPAARALLLEPIAKKARFLVDRRSRPPASTARSRPPRSEPRRSPGTPRHRGRWPAVTARAVAPLAELVELAVPAARAGRLPGRLEAGRDRGRAGRRGTGARRARRRVDRASATVSVPGLDGHRLVVVTAHGRGAGGLSARPWRAASAGRGDAARC